jgi:hypothetical protein
MMAPAELPGLSQNMRNARQAMYKWLLQNTFVSHTSDFQIRIEEASFLHIPAGSRLHVVVVVVGGHLGGKGAGLLLRVLDVDSFAACAKDIASFMCVSGTFIVKFQRVLVSKFLI